MKKKSRILITLLLVFSIFLLTIFPVYGEIENGTIVFANSGQIYTIKGNETNPSPLFSDPVNPYFLVANKKSLFWIDYSDDYVIYKTNIRSKKLSVLINLSEVIEEKSIYSKTFIADERNLYWIAYNSYNSEMVLYSMSINGGKPSVLVKFPAAYGTNVSHLTTYDKFIYFIYKDRGRDLLIRINKRNPSFFVLADLDSRIQEIDREVHSSGNFNKPITDGKYFYINFWIMGSHYLMRLKIDGTNPNMILDNSNSFFDFEPYYDYTTDGKYFYFTKENYYIRNRKYFYFIYKAKLNDNFLDKPSILIKLDFPIGNILLVQNSGFTYLPSFKVLIIIFLLVFLVIYCYVRNKRQRAKSIIYRYAKDKR